VFGIQPR